MQTTTIETIHARIEKIQSWAKDRIARFARDTDRVLICQNDPKDPEHKEQIRRLKPIDYLISRI